MSSTVAHLAVTMMCHIYCAVSLLTLTVAVAVAAPQSSVTVEPTAFDDVIYDQRQNGTENVRINLSDLKVVLAPADGLFQIMSMAGAQFLAADLPTETGSSTDECTGFKCTNRHRQTAKKSVYTL